MLLMSAVVTGTVDGYAVRKFDGDVDRSKVGEEPVVNEQRKKLARESALGHVFSYFSICVAWCLDVLQQMRYERDGGNKSAAASFLGRGVRISV